MHIEQLKILGGVGKSGQNDLVEEIVLKMGDVISIVGQTGSGKTTLINDIAVFANNNTPTKRRVLINGETAPEEFMNDPSKNPVAFITQHTNFLSDLPVKEFLEIHAGIRRRDNTLLVVEETIDFANQITGEPINSKNSMTELSGGQTRALLIADAVIIGNSPIILLDEIENAGIHRTKALELLKRYEKIFIFVTHDPRIALLSDFRLIMQNGAMIKTIYAHDEELAVAEEIKKLDDLILHFRKLIRNGERLNEGMLMERFSAVRYKDK
ncbi:MAG TPA: ATP-binding cassette domain-containing protein [Candidatus Omnitrophota bacterium]|nr:ATP-binding cassette domain-containing protein [Candidatus Omnitrophota bacterium]HPT39591.1 ATP-binding cassette domain-containing protein [Candidatus Omnitrophota bacterium]